MKKKIIASILIMSTVLLGSFYFKANFSRSYHHTFAKSTDLGKENIEGIYLNDEIDSGKIVSKYGKISDFSHDNVLYNYYFLREGIEVATNKDENKIIRFIVNDKNLKTEKGIKVGDKKDKIIELYGDNYYSRLEQGTNIIGYVDKEKDYSIEFWIGEEGIIFYRFDYTLMMWIV